MSYNLFLKLLCVGCAWGARVGDLWGTNIHWTQQNAVGEAAMLARAFRVARMDFSWASIEKTCGTFDFSAYDSLLGTLEGVGVRPYWILDYGNPCYPPPAGARQSSCSTAACIAAFGKFASAAVARFHGHGIIWETINEPNGMGGDNATDLAALAAAAAPAFAAQGELFVGPATAGMDFVYIEKAFAAGILSSYTNVSVHPYRSSALPPETVLEDWRTLAGLIEQYSPPGAAPRPMISGEWGYTTATPPCAYGNKVTELTQAKFLARTWLANALAGVALSIFYDWRDDGSNATDCESNFGTVRHPPTGNSSEPFPPKPAYLAAMAAQRGVGAAGDPPARLPPLPPSPLPPPAVFILQFEGMPPPPTAPTAAPSAPRPAYAAWTIATQCPAPPPPPPSGRTDCGFQGISQAACSARGCCWDATPGTGAQCYVGGALSPTRVEFQALPGLPPATCWSALDVLGQPLSPPTVCSSAGGTLALPLSDSPIYLL
jgi:hypothetical protein